MHMVMAELEAGGWYGGGKGNTYAVSGGGGSGYIGGVQNGETISGNMAMPSVGGNTEIGHSGNGYARITLIH